MRNIATLACVVLVIGLMAAKLHADEMQMPNLKDPKLISAGHNLFLEKQCAHCHGEDGNGGVNLTRRDLSDSKSVFVSIADGLEKNGIRMPAWRAVLTDEEIWAVVAYAKSLSKADR